MKILVVDDEKLARSRMRELIEKTGAEPTTFDPPPPNPLVGMLREEAYDKLREAKLTAGKIERRDKAEQLKASFRERLFPEDAEETAEGHTPAEFNDRLANFLHRPQDQAAEPAPRFQSKMPFWCRLEVLTRIGPKPTERIRQLLERIRRAVHGRQNGHG